VLLICCVCHDEGREPVPVPCERCGSVACARDDRCFGCGRVICERCDSAGTPSFAYPGDAVMHPHNDWERGSG